MWKALLAAGAVVAGACQPEFFVTTADHNATPYASAAGAGTFLVGTDVMLDGTASFDPDGELRSYQWTVLGKPSASTSVLVGANQALASFVVDRAGPYTLTLTVQDNEDAVATSTVKLIAEGPQIMVNAGADGASAWRSSTQLAGAIEVPEGFTLTGFTWQIQSGPSGGGSLSNTSTLTPTFSCSTEGTYVVRLRATTQFNSAYDDVNVVCTAARQTLPLGFMDAEYSKALDRFVIVANGPDRLYLHDPAAGTSTFVALPHMPKVVSVSPDGLRAVVGYKDYASTVNLQTMAVITTYALTIDLSDIVYGADNRVHCFEYDIFGFGTVLTINLTNGNITNNQVTASGFARARLHPGGTSVYSTTYGSPGDLEHYNVSTSPITRLRDSPYHGEYAFGEPWFTEDGANIITRSRNVFYSSTNSNVDMTYRQALDGVGEINWAVHSAAANRIATLSIDYNNLGQPVGYHVRRYNASTLAPVDRIDLPLTGGMASEGRIAAYRADGSMLYVITRAGSDFSLFAL